MKIKIFADGSNKKEIFDLYENNPLVKGFTTNPSLMKKAGVTNYAEFIKEVTSKVKDLPISFEVVADDILEMVEQAKRISDYGENIYVKIPITTTTGNSTQAAILDLISKGIKVNVTAVMTHPQINMLSKILPNNKNNIVSIFAGRISDTGRDAGQFLEYCVGALHGQCDVLWASTRHVYNIYEANYVGCDIITATPDQIKKLSLEDKNLEAYSLETVKMFFDDAKSSGLII